MIKRSSDKVNLRLRVIYITYGVVCAIFISRLFVIQVLHHDQYRALAQEQYWNLQDLPPKRGNIFSSDGYPLATTQLSYLLYAEPNKIINKDQTAIAIAKALSNTKDKLPDQNFDYDALLAKYKKLLNLNLYWVGLERDLTPSQRDLLANLKLENVGFEDQSNRYYPETALASHILGFVASSNEGEKRGYYGIEGLFDGDLKGKPGRVIEERDALGEPILVGGHTRVNPINGSDIYLTIDRAVQYILEKRLKEGVEKYKSISGSVIVMDPFTGDVIAMANYPTYDPRDFNNEEKESPDDARRKTLERRNLAIQETYEPGSVIKGLTMATALDTGKVVPETTFVDDGPVNYSGYFINNWDGKHHGVQTMIELLQKSNNIGAAWVGHLVGPTILYEYFTNFGLGVKTGIDLQGEDTGIINDSDNWTDIDIATASFGQGLSATPLQVLNAFNTLSNGGKLMRPRIVSKIIDDDREVKIPVKTVRQVISKTTSDTISDMLVKTVDGGEAKFFVLKTYQIAGKTGTAQIPDKGKYDPTKTNATFVGYLANSRKFSMIVKLDQPTTSTFAAETAVPLWMTIAGDLVKYYGIIPDRQPIEEPYITKPKVLAPKILDKETETNNETNDETNDEISDISDD